MSEQQPHNLNDVLARAYAEIAAGELPDGCSEEVELHAPVRLSREPVELDTETAAALRELLGQSPRE